ncbi:MAG: acetamidase/formamidase family protein, partial [Thermomicrobium sp.]
PWGGNLDLVELGSGSTIWLPVQRPEGYLYIGDVHAAMGAGEPAHVAIEAAARVIVRTTVDPEVHCRAPRIRTGETLLLVSAGPTVSAAQQSALQQAMEVLRTEFALSPREAYAYACACLSYRFGGPAGPVVLAELPLQPFDHSPGMRTPS